MSDLFLGLDIGTSGARAIIADAAGDIHGEAKSAMTDHGPNHRDPAIWKAAATVAVEGALAGVERHAVRAVCVDGTSGTMVAVDRNGQPLCDGVMYNDPCPDNDLIASIAESSPPTTAARGATSGLARAVGLSVYKPYRILHQADWIAMMFGNDCVTDENNALKTGYDPVAGCWPDWMARFVDLSLLPDVVPAGRITARATGRPFGLSDDCAVVAGTTDGCASFLATGASQAGDGVTALGTTLTIKLLSHTPVFAPEYGIYSHRVLGLWLAGGASNTGGNVLKAEFPDQDIRALSARIDTENSLDLGYYPLSAVGERFPINDPALRPCLGPRPSSDADHLKAIFEGIASIEALGYRRLAELGAPALRSVRTVGGGATNPAWTRIRSRELGVPFDAPKSSEAAYGTALLARAGR